MGIYINPGNSGFTEINKTDYVDKTGLIELVNQTIGTADKLSCVTRPRRFGKSYAAKMLTAYYDCSCSSDELFSHKKIAEAADYREHLNQYNVIYLDITGFISSARAEGRSLQTVPSMIQNAIRNDMDSLGFQIPEGEELNSSLIRFMETNGSRKLIFIIDEWDALIREAKGDEKAQLAYLNLLRGWFKNNNFTPKAVAAAYMTGILPIKKDGSQSAISDFNEYTMIKPRMFGEYVGFTEHEVKELCRKNNVDFASMKRWYDGYTVRGIGSVYNPNSVMKAIRYRDYDSYWTETSAAEGLLDYISKDYNGLTKTIAELIGGIETEVFTTGFANDLTTFRGKDDVLTLMIHLGYVAYDAEKNTVRIPNEEVRLEFQRAIHQVDHQETLKRLARSEQLFLDTIHKNEEAVAACIEAVHAEETSPLHYNREDSLRSVIKLAYYSYRDHYLQFEELPAGEGYADIVYLPNDMSGWPALLIELKWDQSADGAIDQILKRKYPASLENLHCPLLLVGISYNKDGKAGEKKHTARIIEYKNADTG